MFKRYRIKLLLVPALLLFLLHSGSCALQEAYSKEVRVATWNVEWFPGRSPRPSANAETEHRKEVQQYLPTLHPDILILQEIRDKQAAEWIVDQLGNLDMHVVSEFLRPNPSISLQIVIASRYKAIAQEVIYFTGDEYDYEDMAPYRGFVFAALESPLGGTLLVYGLHLKSNRGDPQTVITMRESAAIQILQHVSQAEKRFENQGPVQVIVAGDFNTIREDDPDRNEQTITIFQKAGFHSTWDGVPFEKRQTWPPKGNFGAACFDYILTKGLPPLTATMIPKPPWKYSDHHPVILTIPQN